MWKDFVAINGSECVRVLTCIAIDDPLGGGRSTDTLYIRNRMYRVSMVEERNYLHSRRLQIAYI